jgi:hypothetical protein
LTGRPFFFEFRFVQAGLTSKSMRTPARSAANYLPEVVTP